MGQKVVRHNRNWTDNSSFNFLVILCLFVFLVSSCENPFIEKVLGLKTITFDTNGGSGIPEQKLIKGERIIKPGEPTKSGYIFIGWYIDNETFMEEWDFSVIPEKDIILYAKWEEIAAVHYTLILDTNDLTDNGDSVSFSASDVTLETSASGGSTVRIYYTIGNTHTNNWLLLYIDGETIYETITPGTGYYDYKVDPADADDFGVITIQAYSIHSNLNPLHPPAVISFDKTGTISYTANDENPADTTYRFTLYRGNEEVAGFVNQPINNVVPENIVNKMLENAGDYHVKVWAQTETDGYMPSSININSQPAVHVYQVNLTIGSAENGEDVAITVSGRSEGNKNNNFVFNAFGGDTVTLTASPGINRYVTWSGTGTSDGNTCTVTVTGNTTVTAVFADTSVIVTSGLTTTYYANLTAALDSITAAGTYTVTLLENQMLAPYTFTANAVRDISLVSQSGEKTVQIAGNETLFTVNAGVTLTLGSNITLNGSQSSDASLVVISSGKFVMQNGSKISGHKTSAFSGAVYVNGANAVFEMKGGIIEHNESTNINSSLFEVGGVYAAQGSFVMEGGIIASNTGAAGDVYIFNNSNISISGNSIIEYLVLNANASANASINIPSNWIINGTTISLQGGTNLSGSNGTITYWENKTVLTGTGLTGDIVNNINSNLIHFIDVNKNTQPISATHIIGTAGTETGKLILNPGSGTQIDPFLIYNETDLRRVGTGQTYNGKVWSLSAHYKLTANITLTQGNWTPIGTETNPFSGWFDGGGYTISNLTITGSTLTGFFGSIDDGFVENLHLQIGSAGINGTNYTGGIAGKIKSAYIDNCSVSGGSISTNNQDAGGIAGYVDDSVIQDCYTTSNVTNTIQYKSAGGIAGTIKYSNSTASIINCYSTGNISGYIAGGITGFLSTGNTSITYCYSTGTISGSGMIGGIAGDIYLNSTIINCIALNPAIINLGDASASFGRIAGHIDSNAISNKARSDMPVNGAAVTNGTLTNKEGQNVTVSTGTTLTSVFSTGWDTNVWNIPGGNLVIDGALPTLKNMPAGTQYPVLRRAVYEIGDTGPAGGIIFYHDPNGFIVQGYGNPSEPGYFAEYTAYYLEAAPENESGTSQWGAYGTLIAGVTTVTSTSDTNASLIGNGRRDTRIIVNHLGTSETGRAAQVCAGKSLSVYTDWFLPSLGELNEFDKLKGQAGVPQTGIPTTGQFWSSSQGDLNYAWVQDFANGGHGASLKNYSGSVRAIRAF